MKFKSHDIEQVDLDLTPLIDCVFLLILFFLLTTNLSLKLEDVDLPFALEGVEAESNNPDAVQPLIINVMLDRESPADSRSGLIRFNGESHTEKELEQTLKREAAYDADPRPRGRGRGYEKSPGGQDLSKLAVLLRSDKRVRAEFTRKVFQACAKAGIYKIKVSALEP